jgi:hypothetical protein
MPDTFDLNGLDGSNPLAFLASLGALRGLSIAMTEGPPPRLSWRTLDGALRPVLHAGMDLEADALCESLREQLQRTASIPALGFAADLSVTGAKLREVATLALQECAPEDRTSADYVAAFGCESITDPKSDNISDTALRTMSGAGHQHFLAFMRQLLTETTAEELHTTIFHPWAYTDSGPSMRWDPADDRRYALRWTEPSGDPIRTVRGANALAVLGLPLLPTQPLGNGLGTTAFSTVRRQGIFLTWPIWAPSIPLEVVRSLLALKGLQGFGDNPPPRGELASRGIIEVFRSQRITQGKYRNFASARPI